MEDSGRLSPTTRQHGSRGRDPLFNLYDKDWPIRTHQRSIRRPSSYSPTKASAWGSPWTRLSPPAAS